MEPSKIIYELVSNIFSAKEVESRALTRFENLVNNDFVSFDKQNQFISEGVETMLELQAIVKKLRKILSFPAPAKKSLVIIGGGFSSGKSAFLNSFFSAKNLSCLEEGLTPTTSIPTYVTGHNLNKIKIHGYTASGGKIPIDSDAFTQIIHNYITDLPFSLRSIMPYISVSANLKPEAKNLCFVDTPGYDSNQIGLRKDDNDLNLSKEYYIQGDALIWLIACKAGTLVSSDRKILQEIHEDNPEKKIYVLCTRADEEPVSNRRKVIDEIWSMLEEYDIVTQGISAFSTRGDNNENLSLFKGVKFYDFLSSLNGNHQSDEEQYLNEIKDIFKKYERLNTEQLDAFNADKRIINQYRMVMTSQVDELKSDKLRNADRDVNTPPVLHSIAYYVNNSENNDKNTDIDGEYGRVLAKIQHKIYELQKNINDGKNLNIKFHNSMREIFREVYY